MTTYRHKDVRPGREVVRAWRFEKEGADIPQWLRDACRNTANYDLLSPIQTSDGAAALLITNTSSHDVKSYDVAHVGDWIVEDASSDYFRVFALDDERFRAWYEPNVKTKTIGAAPEEAFELPDVTYNDTPAHREQWTTFLKYRIDSAITDAFRVHNINVELKRDPPDFEMHSGQTFMRPNKGREIIITISYTEK